MVYNPYEDLKKQQDKMHNSGLGAFIKPVQQGADAFAGAMENSPVAAPMRRVMADNAAQKTMIATDQNRKERTALGAQFPEGREVFSNNRGMVSNMEPARSAEVVTEARGLRPPVAQAAGMTPTAPVKAPVVAGGMIPTSGEGANNPTPVLNAAQGQLPGNTGQVQAAQPAAGAGIGVNLSERDKAIKASFGAVDNEVARMGQKGIPVSPQQAEQIANLKQQAGFLRGGTDRVPVGPDGRPIRPGGAGLSGSNYSFQGSPEAAQRFNSAVSPGEYSPEANAARALQKEQFDARMGVEKVDPVTGMTPSQVNAMKGADRLALAKLRLDDRKATGANEIARETLSNQGRMTDTQIAGAGLDQEGKRMTIEEQKKVQGLQAIATSPTSTPEQKASAIKELELRGVYKPQKDEFEFVKRKLAPAGVGLEAEEVIDVMNKRTGEKKGGGAGLGEGWEMKEIQGNPAYLDAYNKADPKKKQEILAAMRAKRGM